MANRGAHDYHNMLLKFAAKSVHKEMPVGVKMCIEKLVICKVQ